MQWSRPRIRWKAQLRDGTIEPAVAIEVSRRIRAHQRRPRGGRSPHGSRPTTSSCRSGWSHLLATAERHPDVAPALRAQSPRARRAKLALVHAT
jgi:hypothetical protein